MGSPMLAGSSLVYSDVQNQDFDQLVRQHATLVKRIAHHMLGRLPDSVQLDDLIQAGMIGLLEASRKYDGGKGASLKPMPVSVSAVPCWMKSVVATGLRDPCIVISAVSVMPSNRLKVKKAVMPKMRKSPGFSAFPRTSITVF